MVVPRFGSESLADLSCLTLFPLLTTLGLQTVSAPKPVCIKMTPKPGGASP
jgi:hypothetical protein